MKRSRRIAQASKLALAGSWLLPVLAATGCVTHNRFTLRESLLETDRQWEAATQGKDADRVASFWTDDAAVYAANRPPVVGKKALREMVAKNRSIPGFAIHWGVAETVISRSGDLAYTLGPYEITDPSPTGEIATQKGHHICTWRREKGTWKCMLEVHAPLPLPPNAATATAEPLPANNNRPKISTSAELPRQTYPVSKQLSEFFMSREDMAALALQVRNDVQTVLSSYDIADETLLKELHRSLAEVALIIGENDVARDEFKRAASLEEKPAAKLLSGLIPRCAIDAQANAMGRDVHEAFRRVLSERVSAMPWAVVQEDVEQLKGRTEIITENFLLGMIQTRIAPGVEKAGHISGDTARQLLASRAAIDVVIPFKQDVIEVLGEIIDRNRIEKKDIWAERNVDLTSAKDLNPVLIGIWDSGVDPSVFSSRVYVNDREVVNGIDDDGNGFVDDVHGIAFSWMGDRISGPLAPLSEADRKRLPALKDRIKGLMDMRAGISSPQATATRQMLSELPPNRVGPFMEDFWLFFNFVHGTGVAGIAVEGNPAARLIIARIEFPHETLPPPWFEEHARAHAEEFQATVDYFKSAGVRVVNMSWGMTPQVFEKGWESNGIGESAEKRAKDAAVLFGLMKEGMIQAIDSAPDILFVVAAGNADSDSTFDLVIPASIDRPNVLTVGAVDKAGDVAGFTSFGPSVDIYANGHEVDCVLPGGDHLRLSGTSQAAPQVTNLAAKLLALRPALSAAELAGLIRQEAFRSQDGRISLVHPANTCTRLRNTIQGH